MNEPTNSQRLYIFTLILFAVVILARLTLSFLSGQIFGWPNLFSENAPVADSFENISFHIQLLLVAAINSLFIFNKKINPIWQIVPAIVIITVVGPLVVENSLDSPWQYFILVPLALVSIGAMLNAYYRTGVDLFAKFSS